MTGMPLCREEHVERLAARSLKRRALRHLVAAIQAYLQHKQQCKAADALLARHAQARLLHRWHQRVHAAQGARHLGELRSLRLAQKAFQVDLKSGHVPPSVCLIEHGLTRSMRAVPTVVRSDNSGVASSGC